MNHVSPQQEKVFLMGTSEMSVDLCEGTVKESKTLVGITSADLVLVKLIPFLSFQPSHVAVTYELPYKYVKKYEF